MKYSKDAAKASNVPITPPTKSPNCPIIVSSIVPENFQLLQNKNNKAAMTNPITDVKTMTKQNVSEKNIFFSFSIVSIKIHYQNST